MSWESDYGRGGDGPSHPPDFTVPKQHAIDTQLLEWAKRVDQLEYEKTFYKKRFEEMTAANLSLRTENNELKAEIEKLKAQVPKRFKRIG